MSPFVWAATAAHRALQVLAVPAGATPIAAAGSACAYTQSASAEAAFSYVAPLASASPFTGTFDASLLPVLGVEVCGPLSGPVASVAQFSSITGSGAQVLRLDSANQQYIVNWSTLGAGLAVGGTYRITVHVAGLKLGAADVAIVGSPPSTGAPPTGALAVVNGSTLPIKFRVAANPVTTAWSMHAQGASAGQVAATLNTQFGLGAQPAAQVLQLVRYAGAETMQGLKGVFGLAAQDAAAMAKSVGYGVSDIMLGLKQVYAQTGQGAASIAKAIGYEANKVVVGLRDVFSLAAQDAASIAKTVGFGIAAIFAALAEAFALGFDAIIVILRTPFAWSEIAAALGL